MYNSNKIDESALESHSVLGKKEECLGKETKGIIGIFSGMGMFVAGCAYPQALELRGGGFTALDVCCSLGLVGGGFGMIGYFSRFLPEEESHERDVADAPEEYSDWI